VQYTNSPEEFANSYDSQGIGYHNLLIYCTVSGNAPLGNQSANRLPAGRLIKVTASWKDDSFLYIREWKNISITNP